MLMPSLFTKDLFDDFFDPHYYGHDRNQDLMKTDVKETEKNYELIMDIPGVKKDDLTAELKDGYLTVSASTSHDNDEKDADGRYIRRERFRGNFSRSFYVGEQLTEEEIKAKFEDGVLKLTIPKQTEKPAVEEKKYIAIEG